MIENIIENIEQTSGLQRKLDLVVRTGMLMAREPDLSTLVQSVTDAGLELSGAQIGVFSYQVPGTGRENQIVSTLPGVDPRKFFEFAAAQTAAALTPGFEGASVVRSADITKDPRNGKNLPHYDMPRFHFPVRSFLSFPVKAQSDQVLGCLSYGHEDVGVFDQEAEDLVAMVAAQAAIVIQSFHLRVELDRKIEELEEVDLSRRDAAKHLNELAAIVESSDDAILSKDLNGRIISWNRAASRILGYSHEEVVGKSILMLIPPELQAEEKTILGKIRAGERIDHFETVRLTKSGERLNVSLSISPVRDASGIIVGASKTLRDITGKKRLEASLIQSEKIAAIGRMAATIAHEINNPLEAIINMIFLARTNVEDRKRTLELLTAAESEITRVSHIANRTLGFYRENDPATSVSLADLVLAAIKIYEPKCKAADIRIEKDLRSACKIVLRVGEINQVVSNLIANSIHAMPSGGTLSIAVADADEHDGAGATLTVQDSGMGIPANVVPMIFDAFFTTRGSIGTGIGLFVAKQFVEGHGGKIGVESNTDAISHGTKMTVFLPLENPHSEKA
jgi:PAS domain S-box-containing protein